MASILVFYDSDNKTEQQRFEQAFQAPEQNGALLPSVKRIGPAAFRLQSTNVNAIRVHNLREQFREGTLRWVTVEDDDIQESKP